MKGLLFYQDNTPAHKSVVAMAAVHDCDLALIDHPPHSPDLAPSIFCSPTWKNTWLGSSIGPMIRPYLQFRTFSRIRMRASIPQESKCCNTDGRSVWWTTGETMLKNKPHLVKFDHCIIVSLWTFQPNLIHWWLKPYQKTFKPIDIHNYTLLKSDVTRRDHVSVVMDAGSRIVNFIVNFIHDGTVFA